MMAVAAILDLLRSVVLLLLLHCIHMSVMCVYMYMLKLILNSTHGMFCVLICSLTCVHSSLPVAVVHVWTRRMFIQSCLKLQS